MTTSVKRAIQTPSGLISYREQGAGAVALFVHGVLLNGHLWRNQLQHLSDCRRCIAPDLLAHGDTRAKPGQGVSFNDNVEMLKQFLDALGIEKVDLVANDSGGGIAQIFAARYPHYLRSLTLTNGDTHDNWPPEAFKPFVAMVAAGGLRGAIEAMLADKANYRAPEALGLAYEHPQALPDEVIEGYLRPFLDNAQRLAELERFVGAFDNRQTVAIEAKLRELNVPTLIAWGTDDIYFDVKWSHWLAETIPGTTRRVELKDARIFFPEERWMEFNVELRRHWQISA